MNECTHPQISVTSKLVSQHNNGISSIHSSYLQLLHNNVIKMQLFNFKTHVAIALQHNSLFTNTYNGPRTCKQQTLAF
jgi:hypothetical protein